MMTLIKLNLKIIAVLLLSIMVNIANAADSDLFKKDKDADEKTYISNKGKVVDENTQEPLIFASVAIEGTNIATVTNTEGHFVIKIPKENNSGELKISFMGYETKTIPISELKVDKNNTIKMKVVTVKLSEINVFPNNPRLLIEKVLENRSKNYQSEAVIMRSFYRETVQKRKKYIGLSEAVVDVYKQPYTSIRRDAVKLYKGRRSQSVEKMDTLLFKLQGGPYSTLLLDIIKDPYLIIADDVMDKYLYTYENITRIDGQLNYVISFKQHEFVSTPLFYGKFYINVDNFAITNAFFNLNTENRNEASAMFIKKKPMRASVYPTSANYLVKYSENNGKWYYNYSRGEVAFKVNWKKRLFSTTYSTMVEMAVTDWSKAEEKTFRPSDRIKMNVIMNDAVNGFSDKDFWGELNTIEPEKSIETAIKKIRKNLN
ncbi:MAG: carboxypeptidase-like regulatory domain-containing protein [Salinivirgaceae bacterium]|jgi:hypothetical protein|nr:carboxypeptidase-like regulatory domain-containing protein [Salinivirgaceae bacterium]